jgi:DNA-binding NtrC family response regulator
VVQISNPDIVVSDYLLPDGNVLELLPRLKNTVPDISIIVLTGHGSIDLAVQAVKAGAEQFFTKPVDLPVLLTVIQRLLDEQRNRKKQLASTSQPGSRISDPFIGTNPAIRLLAQKAKKLLTTESPILIQGETGTGKGVLASWLHRNGPRSEKPFVDINCAAISRELLETELFGHEKGAFTGAITTKLGLFEVAHAGTIFLDEIGDMDLQVQPKLLKVLEEKRFRRLGDIRERLVDVRLITATHKNLSLLVQGNKFRDDLYFRINTFTLKLPPLRDRIEDIPILARHLLNDITSNMGCSDIALSSDLERSLQTYPWPGNIRELRNALESAVLLSEHHILTSKDWQVEQFLAAAPGTDDQVLTLLELERQHIEKVLRKVHGHVDGAAKRLGLSKSALYEKIKKHGINLSGIPKY